jgi:hypothetical protein
VKADVGNSSSSQGAAGGEYVAHEQATTCDNYVGEFPLSSPPADP